MKELVRQREFNWLENVFALSGCLYLCVCVPACKLCLWFLLLLANSVILFPAFLLRWGSDTKQSSGILSLPGREKVACFGHGILLETEFKHQSM